jgi:phage shock protein PspC (stress-responsive transcriptional regulator)
MSKLLFRGDGYIAGVCEGLGEWSGIPSVIWRLCFLFVFPYAVTIYILLWIFINKK